MADEQKVGGNGFVAPAPPPTSSKPDADTLKGPAFFPDGAPNQVFRFHAVGISYGTDDKAHAASIVLSIILASLLAVVFFIGLIFDRVWIPDAIKLLGTAFTFTAGVAIGKSGSKD